MMQIRVLFIFLAISFSSILYSQEVIVPSSTRSKNAIKEKIEKVSVEMESLGFSLGNPVFIRIFKDEKLLEVWVQEQDSFQLFKNYNICYFSGGLGTKTKQGDGKSPEGFYFIRARQLNPYSSYHLSFNIGYPNQYERLKRYTGSALMVHGNCVSVGCYAMGDENIEEIWTIIDAAFREGQSFFRLHIFPFQMTEEKLEKYSDEKYSQWQSFWKNLKSGYDFFEENKLPPNVRADSVDSEVMYLFN